MSESADQGPLPPYGPALADAAARGDLQEMEAVAEAARRALYAGSEGAQPLEAPSGPGAVNYQPITDPAKVIEVRTALDELERKIASLRPTAGE